MYLGALDRLQPEASGWQKLWKGIGLVILIYGGTLLVGASSGGNDMFRPLTNISQAADNTQRQPSLEFTQIKGLNGLEQALKQAAAQNKPAMLDFYADWCVSCIEMERKTFSDPDVQAALADTVLLKADVTLNDAKDKALLDAFGLFGPPSILFFDRNGEEMPRFRLMGFLDADEFEAHSRAALDI